MVAGAPEAVRIVDRIALRIGAIGGHRPPDQLGARDTLLGGERVEPLDIIVRNVREKAHHVLISYRDITSMLTARMGKRGSIRDRTEGRREGNEVASRCRSRGSPVHKNKNNNLTQN